MTQKKINFAKEIVGKVLYKNGRRHLKIISAQRIQNTYWVFMTGIKLTDSANPYFVINEITLKEALISAGRYRVYWEGNVIEFRDNKTKEK